MELSFKLKPKMTQEQYEAWEKYIKEEYSMAENEMVKKSEAMQENTIITAPDGAKFTIRTPSEEMKEIEAKMWEGVQQNKKANAKQVGGSHYKGKGIQPWDVIDDCFSHAEVMGFYKGNALKYIMRAGSKGPAREDYEKAIHYLEKLLEVL